MKAKDPRAKDSIRAAVDVALEQGKKQLEEFERKRGRTLPLPVSTSDRAAAAFREHYHAALEAAANPSLYSAILQHWLVETKGMPFPRKVFQENFYELTSAALSPDGEERPVFPPTYKKAGRPSLLKDDSAMAELISLILKWSAWSECQNGSKSSVREFLKNHYVEEHPEAEAALRAKGRKAKKQERCLKAYVDKHEVRFKALHKAIQGNPELELQSLLKKYHFVGD